MKLIVGLGNPGKKYEKTRHNAGFMALDKLHHALAEHSPTPWKLSTSFNACIAECTFQDTKLFMIKPLTYMNRSGESVGLVMNYYRIAPDDVIVAHDDKDIPLGEVKLHTDRGHAGHNGVKSISEHIKTTEYTRVRIGIAPKDPSKIGETSVYVLKKFGLFEKKQLDNALRKSVDKILWLLS